MPSELGLLTNLQTLILAGNQITNIPSLSALRKLVQIDLSSNRISSRVWSFKNSTTLLTLDLHSNLFYGDFTRDTFDLLPALTVLDVSQNLLTGPLPDLSQCVSLTYLSFALNKFAGLVPPSWENLKALQQALLGHNELISPVTAFFSLPVLSKLDLSYNSTQCSSFCVRLQFGFVQVDSVCFVSQI